MERNIHILGTTLGAVLLVLLFIASSSVPFAEGAGLSRFGGGNALMRAESGESQGASHAHPISGLFSRLAFAGGHGGREEDGGTDPNRSEDVTQDSEDGEDYTTNTTASGDGEESSENSNESGGADGGDGGSGGAGGLIRAGNVVSNSFAVTAINQTLIRISGRDL